MGFEPTVPRSGTPVFETAGGITKTPENTVNPSHQQALAPILLHDTCKADPDLAAVVAAWPKLPEAIRAGILAMVETALGSRPDRGAKAIGCEEGEV